MSFTWFANTPLRTREQVAAEVHAVSLARGLDQLATVLCCMAIDIEVGTGDAAGNPQWWCPANPTNYAPSMQFDHDSLSNDGRSSGYLQQQPGPNDQPWWGTAHDMMTLSSAANNFLDRLADDYAKAANNPTVAGQLVQAVQGSAFPARYQTAWNTANDVVSRALAAGTQPVTPSTPTAPVTAVTSPVAKPDFNEYPLWSPNHQSRNGTKVDLWLWHTEEGDIGNPNAADNLARNDLDNPASQVSYHYTASQAPDGGVTVCDVVNTDQASWSVLSANDRSIDFCLAGSTVTWTRQQWMANSKVIDVGCYLSVLDCIKYGITPNVIAPDPANNDLYHCAPPGISDHKYVTYYLKDGTHTDVGPNFPWDYVTERTAYWVTVLNGKPTTPTTPTTGGTTVAGNPYQQDVRADGSHYSALAYSELVGPLDANGQPTGWSQLGGLSVVDFLEQLGKKVDGIVAAPTTAAVQAAVRAGGISGAAEPSAATPTPSTQTPAKQTASK